MGAVVNDVPVARQSRDPARPQAGESLTLEYRQNLRRAGESLLDAKQGGRRDPAPFALFQTKRCLHRDTPIRNGAAQPHGCATDFFPRRSAALVKFIFVFYGIKTERIGVIYADADWFFIDLFVIDDHNFFVWICPNDKIICSMLLRHIYFKAVVPCQELKLFFQHRIFSHHLHRLILFSVNVIFSIHGSSSQSICSLICAGIYCFTSAYSSGLYWK